MHIYFRICYRLIQMVQSETGEVCINCIYPVLKFHRNFKRIFAVHRLLDNILLYMQREMRFEIYTTLFYCDTGMEYIAINIKRI